MMDPEPGRCRRTDGKKWRCSKNVVPHHKYCERHMHRGRQRSRKPVEVSQVAASSDIAVSYNSNNIFENSNTKLSISTPTNLQLMTPLSTYTSANHDTNTAISINELSRTVSRSKDTATTISTAITTITHNENSTNNHNIDGKGNNRRHIGSERISTGNNIIVGKNIGLAFSPKSVLQGCSTSSCYKSNLELEPGRCRRTDGKKWRCSRDVVPDQKYCGRHMHRGAKKHVEASQLDVLPVASAANSVIVPKHATMAILEDSAYPNTSLSIAIPTSPQLTTNNEKSTTSSCSETTITDTTISACENGTVLLQVD